MNIHDVHNLKKKKSGHFNLFSATFPFRSLSYTSCDCHTPVVKTSPPLDDLGIGQPLFDRVRTEREKLTSTRLWSTDGTGL